MTKNKILGRAALLSAVIFGAEPLMSASITPTWNNNARIFTATHTPGTPNGSGVISPNQTVALGASATNTFSNTISFSPNSGSTKAKAGGKHTESTTQAKAVFASGMGVDQTDPNHLQTTSSNKVDFKYVWNINGAGSFGAFINGSFSIPVGATVYPGGSASVEVNIEWKVNDSGAGEVNGRTPWASTYNFPVPVGASPLTTLTTITAPAAPFAPISLGDGDIIIFKGYIRFTANNDDGPTTVQLLGENPSIIDPQDPESGIFFQNPAALQAYQNTPNLQFDGFGQYTVDDRTDTPEPSAVATIGFCALTAFLRRPSRGRLSVRCL